MNNTLKFFRHKKGLKQNQLARLVGIAVSTYCDIENGNCNPSLKVALILAKVLNTTVEELFPLPSMNSSSQQIKGVQS